MDKLPDPGALIDEKRREHEATQDKLTQTAAENMRLFAEYATKIAEIGVTPGVWKVGDGARPNADDSECTVRAITVCGLNVQEFVGWVVIAEYHGMPESRALHLDVRGVPYVRRVQGIPDQYSSRVRYVYTPATTEDVGTILNLQATLATLLECAASEMAGRNSSPESVVPAAWHPDPAGRHEMRYWDGRSWTSHICDNGAVGIDQL